MKNFIITLTIFLTAVNMILSQNCLIEELETKRTALRTLSSNPCPGLCLTNEQADEVLNLLKGEDSLKIELKTCEDHYKSLDKKYNIINNFYSTCQLNLEVTKDKNNNLVKENKSLEEDNNNLEEKNKFLKRVTGGSLGLSGLLLLILIL